jgi:hypothetical protein
MRQIGFYAHTTRKGMARRINGKYCYFSEGSRDANDAIKDMEHWHCETCGGLPRHMHPRPQAAKRARVSFGPDLAVVTEPPMTKGGSATGHQGGGWGGHWPTRTEMPQLTTGNGKEAMESRCIPIEPTPRRERGTKGKKRLNKNPNGHSHNQRNEHKGQGRKPSGHPPS